MKEFWDFDENKNFITIMVNNIPYKVLEKYPNYFDSVKILIYLRYIIYLICVYLSVNIFKYSSKDQIAIKCFLDIHFNKKSPYYLSEMQIGNQFNGLNKPRNLYKSNQPILGKDGRDRARYRHIFLTLRHNNGSFKTINSIIDLLIHEVTHTMCNHIRWREDDHGEDFIYYENLLIDIYNKIKK
tara:strand:- start:77 stop:628 length:552 start_codon:yes stop_codon:yes gene_type:complete